MQELRVIVAGGRDFTDESRLEKVLFEFAESVGADVSVSIVSGMARGADKLAYEFCQKHNVHCYEMPADWERDGNRAGFVRNIAMANVSDVLIAFWDGESKGTKHMIDAMLNRRKPVYVERY